MPSFCRRTHGTTPTKRCSPWCPPLPIHAPLDGLCPCLFVYHFLFAPFNSNQICSHSDVVTHFSFVMTNIHSKWTFGYCRHTPKSDTCLVMLSDLPWHSTFYRILDHCAELAARQVSRPLSL